MAGCSERSLNVWTAHHLGDFLWTAACPERLGEDAAPNTPKVDMASFRGLRKGNSSRNFKLTETNFTFYWSWETELENYFDGK